MSQPTTCELAQRIAVLIKLSLDVRDGLVPVGDVVPGADPDSEIEMVRELIRTDVNAAIEEFRLAEAREGLVRGVAS